jgi:hypothetical protein
MGVWVDPELAQQRVELAEEGAGEADRPLHPDRTLE